MKPILYIKIFLSVLIVSSYSAAEPDRYTRYLMEKEVDWLSMGMIRTEMRLQKIASNLREEGILVSFNFTYFYSRDEFFILASADESECKPTLEKIRYAYGITKFGDPFADTGPFFGLDFQPPGFDYSDEPTNLNENLARKVIFRCRDANYNLMN